MHSFKALIGAGTMMLASICLLIPNAYATSYPFTASATVDATTLGDAHLTGPKLNLTFLSMQSPGPHFLDCSGGGAECGGQFTIPGQSGASPAVAFGSINGIAAAQILGGLILASPAFLIDGAPPGPFTRQEPLTVSGSLIGVDPNSNVLFSVDLNGTGTADFTGTASTVHGTTIVDFTKVGFTFSGSVTDTPEPSSAMLLGAGLLVGGTFLMRRRRIHPLSAAVALRKLLLLAVSALIVTAPFVMAGGAKAQTYGIGGYDLASANDQVFAFDYDHSGKADHLVLYRPGTGTVWIVANQNGTFVPVYVSFNGIGGYDLKSPNDRIFAFDYNSTGHLDHLVCYRPGAANIWILANTGGVFTPILQSTSGIGGFDLMSTSDIGIAYDARSSGDYDSMLFYRPGTNVAYGIHDSGFGFQTTYVSGYGGNGLGTTGSTFDLSSPADRLTTFTLPNTPRVYLMGYRPGAQIAAFIDPASSSFGIGNYSTSGLGGYDLLSPEDQLISFDYNSTGYPDHIIAYRPGEGIAWILQWVSLATPTGYSPVFQSNFNSQLGNWDGIGGFDLHATVDRIVPFDYDGSGHSDHLLIYRPGTGVVWILQNVNGAFSPVYTSDYLPADYDTAGALRQTHSLEEHPTPQ